MTPLLFTIVTANTQFTAPSTTVPLPLLRRIRPRLSTTSWSLQDSIILALSAVISKTPLGRFTNRFSPPPLATISPLCHDTTPPFSQRRPALKPLLPPPLTSPTPPTKSRVVPIPDIVPPV